MLNTRFNMCARALLYTHTAMAQQSGFFSFRSFFKIGRAALSLALCAPLRKQKVASSMCPSYMRRCPLTSYIH